MTLRESEKITHQARLGSKRNLILDRGRLWDNRGRSWSCLGGAHAELKLVLSLGRTEELLVDLDIVSLDGHEGGGGIGVALDNGGGVEGDLKKVPDLPCDVSLAVTYR